MFLQNAGRGARGGSLARGRGARGMPLSDFGGGVNSRLHFHALALEARLGPGEECLENDGGATAPPPTAHNMK